MCGSVEAQTPGPAEQAVEAAKQYAGTTLTITWEAGLQALDPLNFSGPLWEELTGIKIDVVEIPFDEMFPKTMAEFRAGTGAYDVLNVVPSQMPDLVNAGVIEPLDDYIDQYGFREHLQTIAPVYRDNWKTVNDVTYGLPDDGDVYVLYYRTDLFEDPENQAAFQEKYGYELAPPATWQQFDEIAAFFTDKYAPDLRGRDDPRRRAGGAFLPGALSQRGRHLLRPRHHAGDDQRRGRGQGALGHGQRAPVDAAGRGDLGVRRGAGRLALGRCRDDHLVAAVRSLVRWLRHR
jgi:ABC-type glycerol-3-phosphate transport system substrate-binding protein